jgi:DNA-binding XRE family transcriptional regulator
MQAHTRRHHTDGEKNQSKYIHFNDGGHSYCIPKEIAEKKYRVNDDEEKTISSDSLFKEHIEKYTAAGALLKGLRARENLNQHEFSKLIDVTQANLSKMENGKRPIGKIIAKRLEEVFHVNYRYFLE